MPTCEFLQIANTVPVETPTRPDVASPQEEVPELLRKAAYRVGQPGAWTQHYLGRLQNGTGTYARKLLTGAPSRCMLGALYCEFDLSPTASIHSAYDALVRSVGTGLLADWNDAPQRTQDDVVAALLRAAEIAEA